MGLTEIASLLIIVAVSLTIIDRILQLYERYQKNRKHQSEDRAVVKIDTDIDDLDS